MLSNEQRSQESQYEFPYHYVPHLQGGRFSQARVNRWGYEYLSYLTYVLDQLGGLAFTSLLDIGCGEGRLLHELARRRGEVSLTGVDYSAPAVAFAQAFNPTLNFACGDITDRTLAPGPFDAVTLIDVLEHIPPAYRPAFVQAVADRVRPGGSLIVTVPSTNIPVSKKHYEHFDQTTLTQALGESFQVERVQYLNAKGLRARWVRRLLANGLFILNNSRLATAIYRWYCGKLLLANPGTGTRLFAQCVRVK